jgi:hypothetical protein
MLRWGRDPAGMKLAELIHGSKLVKKCERRGDANFFSGHCVEIRLAGALAGYRCGAAVEGEDGAGGIVFAADVGHANGCGGLR